jgi:hypothetical protein
VGLYKSKHSMNILFVFLRHFGNFNQTLHGPVILMAFVYVNC